MPLIKLSTLSHIPLKLHHIDRIKMMYTDQKCTIHDAIPSGTSNHRRSNKTPTPYQMLLVYARHTAGLTSKEVAERMGITQPAVSKIENNATSASVKTLLRYAQACNHKLIIRFEPLEEMAVNDKSESHLHPIER